MPVLHFDPEHGALELHHVQPHWLAFIPLADGAPLLKGHSLVCADWKGGTLATLFRSPANTCVLHVYRDPTGAPALSLLAKEFSTPTVSNDGRLLAHQRRMGQVEVRPAWGGPPLRQTLVGRFHNNVTVELGERWLGLSIDRTHHLIRWDEGRLTLKCLRGDGKLLGSQSSPGPSVSARPNRVPGFLNYDPQRFRSVAWHNLIAAVDVFGEVFLFEHSGDLVCAFFVYRLALAAWMPDGTCLGPAPLLGRPATPGAADAIGQSLQAAWERGERTIQ